MGGVSNEDYRKKKKKALAASVPNPQKRFEGAGKIDESPGQPTIADNQTRKSVASCAGLPVSGIFLARRFSFVESFIVRSEEKELRRIPRLSAFSVD